MNRGQSTTECPIMISCPSIRKQAIRRHYEISTVFYRLLWGRHIHHGLWDGNESPQRAQLNLCESLADGARIARGESVLDVGCGMGGSAIHLARSRQCHVTGITLSRVQCVWASVAAMMQGVAHRTKFLRRDAETVEFAEGAFDTVWSIECTEHLFDKPAFFRNAARWLKPGGNLAICAWLAGDNATEEARARVFGVCEGFLCPSLGTRQEYLQWTQEAGLVVSRCEDWTQRVVRTWDICRDRAERSRVRWLARCIDADTLLFLDCFAAIGAAYRSGAMRYACLVAQRPI